MQWQEHLKLISDAASVSLAIFFHDVIYDPKAGSPQHLGTFSRWHQNQISRLPSVCEHPWWAIWSGTFEAGVVAGPVIFRMDKLPLTKSYSYLFLDRLNYSGPWTTLTAPMTNSFWRFIQIIHIIQALRNGPWVWPSWSIHPCDFVWYQGILSKNQQKYGVKKSRGHEVTVGFWGMRSTVPMFSTTLSRKPYLVAVNEDLELWRPDCLQVWYQVGEVGNALLDFWYWLVLWLVWWLPVDLSSFLCFWPCFYMCKIARFAPFSFARWGDG